MALVQPTCAIVLGATNVLQTKQLFYRWRPVSPRPVPDSTLRRALAAIDTPVVARIERARAAIRRVVQLNAAGVPAPTIAADLEARTWLLLLHDGPELAAAKPETLRTKLYHLPARLTAHARQRTLHLDRNWP